MRFKSETRSNGTVRLDLASMGPDLYSLHRPNGELVHASDNAVRVLERQASGLDGQGYIDTIHVQDRVAVFKAIGDCLVLRRPQSAQFRLLSRDGGSQRWLELCCEPAPEDTLAGEGPLVLAVTRDISEHRRLEEELRLSRERAESANVAKSLFLANMSHELRTPLNAILGFSELLQLDVMKNMPPERHREYVGLIHSSANHLLQVLTEILDMSKIEAGKYEIVTEPFKVAQTLQTCCAMMRGQADRKQIAISTIGFETLPEITADERAVRQIMINLVSNAVKFTAEGGQVKVAAERVGRNIRIAVSDNGIGISSEHIEKLGIPFYQADSKYDRKYQGTGLGLSVVRGLVELHRGKLAFSSRKGIGTTVTVTLPVHVKEMRPVPAVDEIEIVRLRPMDGTSVNGFSMAAKAAASSAARR